MSELVRVVEQRSVPNNALMLHGLPDVGLVRLIATSHIIGQLKMNEIAYVDSDLLPPIVVLHEGLPHAPLRIFGNNDIIASFGESAIPAKAIHPIVKKLVEWGQSKKARLMISMGGIPVQERQE